MVEIRTVLSTKLTYLLVTAGIFHVVLAVIVYVTGRLELIPSLFDNNGFGGFAPDNFAFREDAGSLATTLTNDGFYAWMGETAQLHVRVYSLLFALFGPLLGYTVLAVEPLNGLYYLAILTLVFKLGQTLSDRRAGILAAAVVALWPSFLLTTLGLLREPLFVASMLAFVLAGSSLLAKVYSWPKGLFVGAFGAGAGVLAWLARNTMEELVLLAALISAGLFVVRQLRARRLLAANLVGVALLLLLTLGAPQAMDALTAEYGAPQQAPSAPKAQEAKAQVPPFWEGQPITRLSKLGAEVSHVRYTFIRTHSDAGSNIDTDVQFASVSDIARYLPRAAMIGFFAPFPNAWFVAGDVAGLAAKLVSGIETLTMYAIEFLAVLGLWWNRQRLSAWLLLLVAAAGVTLLATVLVNVGTIYRLRYAFWIMIIVLGAMGAVRLFYALSSEKEPKE